MAFCPQLCVNIMIRHWLIRGLTQRCLDRPRTTKLTLSALKHIAQVGHQLGIQALPRFAYSGIFQFALLSGCGRPAWRQKAAFLPAFNQLPKIWDRLLTNDTIPTQLKTKLLSPNDQYLSH